MKTKKRVLKKIGQFLCLSLLVIGIQSCETEIPLEDRTPPTFSFQVIGPGVNHTFDQDFDYENYELNLKTGSTYNFTLTGNDEGGVRIIKWTISDKERIVLQDDVPRPWITLPGQQRFNVHWYGNQANPLTGAVLTGNLETDSYNSTNHFIFEVQDFGGESGSVNTTLRQLRVDLTEYHPGVRRIFGR